MHTRESRELRRDTLQAVFAYVDALQIVRADQIIATPAESDAESHYRAGAFNGLNDVIKWLRARISEETRALHDADQGARFDELTHALGLQGRKLPATRAGNDDPL